MCRKETIRGTGRLIGLTLLAVLAVAQTRPDWRKVGGSAVELMLAGPATGPVSRIWFSPDGSQLFARTASGNTFATVDFENWVAVAGADAPPATALPAPARLPESGAHTLGTTSDPSRIYSLGKQLFRSDDGGRSWTNLTQYKSESIIGGGQRDVAISPADPDQLVVANGFGIWRSLDGGLSWSGLNRLLPNLSIRRILTTPTGIAGTRVQTDGSWVLELPPGGTIWFPVQSPAQDQEGALLRQYSAAIGTDITAFGASGATIYAGSRDGRIWVSLDSGTTFALSRSETAGPVERIFVDSAQPRVALAAIGGTGAHVLRTTNNGTFWDDLTANLPDAAAHGITAERAAGAVYVATDRGVFWARADLENASSPAVTWTAITDRLPTAAATDVRLDPAGTQVYVALEGYGVYAAPAPHRRDNLRIVNAADFSTRAAAPGSLLSVVGGRVDSARGGNLDYPVLARSLAESQIQVPFDAAGPTVSLLLQTNAGPVTLPVSVRPVSPAIFVGHDGVPMLVDADSGVLLDGRNPAHSNGRIQILATGLGKVQPDWPTNVAAPLENPPAVVANVKAYLDGNPLQVTRATLAPGNIGWYLVEAQLPPVTNLGTSELYISAGGQESNRVQMVIEP